MCQISFKVLEHFHFNVHFVLFANSVCNFLTPLQMKVVILASVTLHPALDQPSNKLMLKNCLIYISNCATYVSTVNGHHQVTASFPHYKSLITKSSQ
jgi:hypothetical protein